MKYFFSAILFSFLLPGSGVSAQEGAKSWFSNAMNPALSFNALLLGTAARDAFKDSFGESASGPAGTLSRVPGTADHFGLQESELSLISVVDQHWKLNANLVFANDEVTPEEVFTTNTQIPSITLKLGKFKTAFGKHGTLHTHAYPFIEAPVILENSLGGEGFNGEGLEVAYLSPLPWYAELTLGAYSSAESDGGLDLMGTRPDDFAYLGHLKDFVDLGDSLTLEGGGSALMGKGSDGFTHAVFGADLTVKCLPPKSRVRRGLIFQNEWIQKVRRSGAAGVYEKEAEGGYSSLQLHFSHRWWAGLRTERALRIPNAAVFARFSGPGVPEVDADGQALYDPASGDLSRHTVELVWAPSEFSALRADFSYGQIRGGDAGHLDRRVLIQFNQTIGVHPAHNF